MTIEIRPAVPSDAAQILTFITELADYEKARHEVIASVVDIERSLFSEGATAHGLICLRDGLPIGFVGTFGIGFAWGVRSYTPELLWSTEPFLILFFLMYLAIGTVLQVLFGLPLDRKSVV